MKEQGREGAKGRQRERERRGIKEGTRKEYQRREWSVLSSISEIKKNKDQMCTVDLASWRLIMLITRTSLFFFFF